MAKLDMAAFPELGRLMSRREREANYVRSNRNITAERSNAILTFWRELAGRIHEEDNLDNTELILRELKNDVDMLKALHNTLMLQADNPEHATQLAVIQRLLMLLLEIYEKFIRWHWHLKEELLAYYLTINPAMPSKAALERDAKKDSKKGSKQDAKKLLDLAQQQKKQDSKKKQT